MIENEDKDEFRFIKIYKTTNYDQFIFLEENRPVTGSIVEESIKKKNLLLDNPILVTQGKHVLDGQNRLIAAKVLQVPIYYRYALITTAEDISHLQNQKPWLLRDHAHFYKENPNYSFVNEMVEKHDLSLQFGLYSCNTSRDAFRKFRNGEFEIKEGKKEQLAEQFQMFEELINAIKFMLFTVGNTKSTITQKFKRALWTFMKKPEYSQERMVHALKTYPNHVMDLLLINSEAQIGEGLERKLFNYNRKPRNK
jgi:hypothetical protein